MEKLLSWMPKMLSNWFSASKDISIDNKLLLVTYFLNTHH
jgi:hypothetical protein